MNDARILELSTTEGICTNNDRGKGVCKEGKRESAEDALGFYICGTSSDHPRSCIDASLKG